MNLTALPIARYQFSFDVIEPILLPDYAGSTLRGVFGRALRKIACMTKQVDCRGCPLYRSCPYTNIFETPAPENHHLQKFSQVPNAYIIEPPKWGRKLYQIGEQLTFNLVLFGRLIEQLPLIAFAFQRAFEYQVGGGKAKLSDISLFQPNFITLHSILNNGKIENHHTQIEVVGLNKSLNIEIQTPLRLQENGKPLSVNTISKERFLLSLAKRIQLLSEFHFQSLDLNFELLISQLNNIKDNKKLEWLDWQRYSSRQDQKMKLGGVLGNWQFYNLSDEWQQLIYFGQWLHNGKNATFGLGKYQITNL